MQTWVALFRGINVGGNRIVRMADLRAELEGLGLHNVRSYIQSGNVVFEASARTAKPLVKKIGRCVEQSHGFLPELLLLTREELRSAVQSNPFPEATTNPTTLHLGFLATPSESMNEAEILAVKASTERYRLIGNVFYLHAPNGIGRSKLAANLEKFLGVSITSRNFRTADRLLQMADPAD